MQTLDLSVPVEYTQDLKQPGGGESVSTMNVSSQPLFSERLVLQQIRLERLRRLRNWFGIASILSLCALIACILLHVAYDPAAAVLSCCMGTFVVFAMKVHDAKG